MHRKAPSLCLPGSMQRMSCDVRSLGGKTRGQVKMEDTQVDGIFFAEIRS